MRRKPVRTKIRGHWWTIKTARPPDENPIEGLCIFDERLIYLKPGTDLPATLIHEVLHASLPDNDENSIECAERAVMEALKKFGLLIPETP